MLMNSLMKRIMPVAALLSADLLCACNGDDAGQSGSEGASSTGMTMATTTEPTGTEGGTEPTTSVTDGSESETGGGVGSCAANAPIDLEVTGSVTSSVTWAGTVRVSGNLDVRDGAVVTILPGTAIVFDVDTGLEFGWNSQPATVRAEGTAEQPIELCGASPQAGSWRGVLVGKNVTSNSVLEHVIIRHAGSGAQPALTLDAPITLKDVTIAEVGGVGVEAVDFRAGSANLTVTDAGAVPVALTGAGAITRLPLGGDLGDNADDVVELRFSSITDDTTVHDPGIPYRQMNDIDVRDGARLVFEAGVEYRFAVDRSLEIGWNNQPATLMVQGSAEAPVVFVGASAGPGFWGGILVQKNVTSNSKVSHAIVRDGGGGGPVLTIQSPITLEHLTLEDNQAGIFVGAPGLSASSNAVTVRETMGPPMTLETPAITSVPTGGAYVGNAEDVIAVKGGSLTASGTIVAPGVPYAITGTIDVRDDAVVTIAAGVELVMDPDTEIEFGWNNQKASLLALGTQASPIVMRGREAAPGWWRGLKINKNVLSNSKLEHVEIRDGGTNTGANLQLRRPLTITNSHFAGSAGHGILKEVSDPTDYNAGNTFADNLLGPIGIF